MEGDVPALDMDGAAAALGHLEAVAQQGEARHVGAAVDPVFHHNVPGGAVQSGHLPVNAVHHRPAGQPRLGGSGQHAHAQGLGQQQHVPGPGSAVGKDAPGVHEPRHRQPINGLRPVDGVAAGDDGLGLIGLVIPAPQQLLHHVLGHGLRQAQDIQRQLGLPAHGVHIADGVGRGDLSIQERIVHNRREKVRGLHQGSVLVQIIHAGVVGLVIPHQQPGVRMGPEPVQQLRQGSGAYLGSAAGTGGQLRQLHFCFHGHSSYPNSRPRPTNIQPRAKNAASTAATLRQNLLGPSFSRSINGYGYSSLVWPMGLPVRARSMA